MAGGRRKTGGRKGWLSGIKRPAARKRTPLWQWLVGIPIVALLAAGVLAYVYIGYLHPRLGQAVRVVRAEVIRREEKTLPGGKIDLGSSFLLVRVEGKELRLPARLPDWTLVREGDTIEVEVGSTGNGALVANSWRRAAPTSP